MIPGRVAPKRESLHVHAIWGRGGISLQETGDCNSEGREEGGSSDCGKKRTLGILFEEAKGRKRIYPLRRDRRGPHTERGVRGALI